MRKDSVFKNYSEYFRSTRQKFYSKLNEEQNLRKVVKSLYTFLNFFDPELQLINTKK